VTWTNVTGQASYGWTAPAGDVGTLTGHSGTSCRLNQNLSVSDTVYVDSAQAETNLAQQVFYNNLPQSGTYAPNNWVSVNVAGSVPPVSGDYLPGASMSFSAAVQNQAGINFYGFTFTCANTVMFLGYSGNVSTIMQDCTIANVSSIQFSNGSASRHVFRNLALVCGSGVLGSQLFSNSSGAQDTLEIHDSPNLLSGSSNIPLYFLDINENGNAYFRGCDFSPITGSNVIVTYGSGIRSFVTLEECVFTQANLTTGFPSGNTGIDGMVLAAINCDTAADNTNYNSQKITQAGVISTNTGVFRVGGASIEGTALSWKMIGQYCSPMPGEYSLDTFNLATDNQAIGSAHTATVEVIGTGTPINAADLELEIWYQGSSTSPIGTRATTGNVIPSTSALASSTASWTGTPGGAAQKLAVTFTPQKNGVVCGRVNLHSNITVYVDPVITIT
jgi:hypothetical protein